jgi:hypothetical protein
MAGLARQMGWEEADVRQAALAGLLLDVGKATLPDDLVQRAGRLNPEERTLLRTHAQRGHDLLVAEGAMTPGAAGGAAAPRAPQRQRLSPGPAGRGHSADRPHGGAVRRVRRRDLAAPYRAPWDPAEAMRQLARSKGLYDAVVFQHLVKTVGIYPVGALVRLKSEQLAVVLEQHGGSLLTPRCGCSTAWPSATGSSPSCWTCPSRAAPTASPTWNRPRVGALPTSRPSGWRTEHKAPSGRTSSVCLRNSSRKSGSAPQQGLDSILLAGLAA